MPDNWTMNNVDKESILFGSENYSGLTGVTCNAAAVYSVTNNTQVKQPLLNNYNQIRLQ